MDKLISYFWAFLTLQFLAFRLQKAAYCTPIKHLLCRFGLLCYATLLFVGFDLVFEEFFIFTDPFIHILWMPGRRKAT